MIHQCLLYAHHHVLLHGRQTFFHRQVVYLKRQRVQACRLQSCKIRRLLISNVQHVRSKHDVSPDAVWLRVLRLPGIPPPALSALLLSALLLSARSALLLLSALSARSARSALLVSALIRSLPFEDICRHMLLALGLSLQSGQIQLPDSSISQKLILQFPR